MGFITIEGENQIAAKQGGGLTLNIANFVLANIAGLGAEPADRIEAMPIAGDIVDTLPVTMAGYVNTNQVVYSLTMDSSIGDYDFNWIGLVDDEGKLIAVTYTPLIQKRATAGAVPGNNLTRNFLIAYSGIQATVAIAVPAATWQIDFNARLQGIDERERLSNYDLYGHEGFINDGYSIVRQGATTTYDVLAGVGYVGGIRINNAVTQQVVAAALDSIWLDVSLQGDISDVSPVVNFVIDAAVQNDYVDANDVQHYLTKLSDIAGDGSVTDARAAGSSVEVFPSITAVAASNALTIGVEGQTLNFRSVNLTDGVFNLVNFGDLSLVVPDGATLGTFNAQQSRLVLLAIDNAGIVELAVVNASGVSELDESILITTATIDATADSDDVIYSTEARADVPFRIVGFVESTQAVAGTWATTPTLKQGEGGNALITSGLKRSAVIPTTSGTSNDLTGIPSWVKKITIPISGISTNGTSPILLQIGDGAIITTDYLGVCSTVGGTNNAQGFQYSTGFIVVPNVPAASAYWGTLILTKGDGNVWQISGGLGSTSSTAYVHIPAGGLILTGVLDRLRLTTVGGVDGYDAGSFLAYYE